MHNTFDFLARTTLHISYVCQNTLDVKLHAIHRNPPETLVHVS